jgi:hypothetical protein
VTALEDRLRSELRAESEQITPDSIAGLRLPPHSGRPPGRPRRSGARQWSAWVKPLAAAAAVTIAVAGTFALTRAVPSPPRTGHPRPGHSTAPAYYAYTVAGYIYHGGDGSESVPGRYVKVRATATGTLLATISPPKPYNDFTVITADASADTFVLGAMQEPSRMANPSPVLALRELRMPMKFLVLRITPAGRTLLSALSLPEKLAPVRQPSIALSPDGTRLAVAFGGGTEPAYVQVITLATGQTRQWVSAHAPWVPSLNGMGAWTANGRTLMFEQAAVLRSRPRPRPVNPGPIHPATTTRVWLLDTAAPGTSLASAKPLILRAPAGEYPSGPPIITPDGAELIAAAGTLVSWPVRAAGALAVYSPRTGRLLKALAPWAWRTNIHRGGRGGYPSQRVAWTSRSGGQLIVLQPRDELNVLSALAGDTVVPAGSVLLSQRPAGYQELEDALRTASLMAW